MKSLFGIAVARVLVCLGSLLMLTPLAHAVDGFNLPGSDYANSMPLRIGVP